MNIYLILGMFPWALLATFPSFHYNNKRTKEGNKIAGRLIILGQILLAVQIGLGVIGIIIGVYPFFQ